MIYTHPKYDHTQEVQPHEKVRMRLLERAGWSAQSDAPAAPPVPEPEAPAIGPVTVHEVFDPKLADLLDDAGYWALDDLRSASDDDILAISGIGAAKLAHIREVLSGG